MKRKLLLILSICFITACFTLLFSSCTVNSDNKDKTDDKEPVCAHDYKSVTAQPTCTEQGFTTYTCSKCNDSYIDNYVNSLGHNLQYHEAQAATCTEIGWQAYQTCSRCDYSTYKEIPASHSLQSHKAKAATCTEIGWNEYQTCSRCDYTTYKEIPALNHNLQSHGAKAPTCTEIGWEAYESCSRCNYSTYQEIAALNHDYASTYTIDVEATCTTAGRKSKHCSRCEMTSETTLIPKLGHNYFSDTIPATCNLPGCTFYTCKNCNDTYYTTIAASGHSGSSTCNKCGINYYNALAEQIKTEGKLASDGDKYVYSIIAGSSGKNTYIAFFETNIADGTVSLSYNTLVSGTLTFILSIDIVKDTNDFEWRFTDYGSSSSVGLVSMNGVISKPSFNASTNRISYDGFLIKSAYDTTAVRNTFNELAVSEIKQLLTYLSAFTSLNNNPFTIYNFGFTNFLPKMGHDYSIASIRNATCSNNGVIQYSCSTCSSTPQRTISAYDHKWIETNKNNEKTYYTCERCNQNKIETNIYGLNYDLADGNANNPISYTYSTDTFSLNEPTKTGYTFVGWSGTGLSEITKNVTIEKGSFGNREYTAHWAANSYTITYDTNGGTISKTTQEVTYNTPYELLQPEKLGYTFDGWYYKDEKYSDGIWKTTDNITLVAKWVYYTITTSTNNSNAGTYTVYSDNKVTVGETIHLQADTNVGYNFNGWYNGKSLLTKDLNYSFDMPANNIFYTACYAPIDFTISYNLNGGTNNSENHSSYTIETDTFYLAEPTKKGYTFVGWTYYNDDSPNKNVTIENGTVGDKAFTANWQANEYIITYVPNGGTIPKTTQTVIFDSKYTLAVPQKQGYDFGGWYVGDVLWTNGVWQTSHNVTLTANWNIIAYNISYFLYGGTNNPANHFEYNTETPTFKFSAPTKKGYTFVSWYLDNQFTNPVEEITLGSIGNISVFAKWNINTYEISYELNDGVNNSNNPCSYTINNDRISLLDPTKIGFSFSGWYTDSSFMYKVTSIDCSQCTAITLFAKWSANTYKISLKDNLLWVDVTLKYGYKTEKLRLHNGDKLEYPTIPARNNAIFTGWYVDEECNELYDFSSNLNGDLILYAGWFSHHGEYIDATQHNSEKTACWYEGESADYYFVALQGGNFKFYYEVPGSSSSYKSNILVTNKTTGKVLLNKKGLYAITFYFSSNFSCEAGDVIEVHIYGDSKATGFYVTGFANPISSSIFDEEQSYKENASCSIDFTYGEAYSLPIPTRKGYNFSHWAIGDEPIDNSGIWNIPNDETIVAIWTPNTDA